MRTITLAVALAAIAVMALPTQGGDMSGQIHMNPYAAGACAAPGYGAVDLQSGCCEDRRTCCDDVWAGYCENKNRGFCLPCGRPLARPCAGAVHAPCQSGCGMPLAPAPAMIESSPAPEEPAATNEEPEPAVKLELPPPPEEEDSGEKEAESGSDTVIRPLPKFDPAAWKIGESPR